MLPWDYYQANYYQGIGYQGITTEGFTTWSLLSRDLPPRDYDQGIATKGLLPSVLLAVIVPPNHRTVAMVMQRCPQKKTVKCGIGCWCKLYHRSNHERSSATMTAYRNTICLLMYHRHCFPRKQRWQHLRVRSYRCTILIHAYNQYSLSELFQCAAAYT